MNYRWAENVAYDITMIVSVADKTISNLMLLRKK